MLNYLQFNHLNNKVWNGYNYHLYSSTTSYEKHSIRGQTILEKYQSKVDLLNRSSSYDCDDDTNTSIDSPLDLSKDSTLFNGKKMIESVDTSHMLKLKNGLEFKENSHEYDQSPIDLSKATTCPRKVYRNYKINNSKFSDSISSEISKPKVRRQIMHCDKCSYITNHKNDLRKHMYGIHLTTNEVVCPKCGKTSKHKYSLKIHLSYCGKEPRFFCAYCPYKSRKRQHLQKHALKHVDRNTAYESPCNQNGGTLPSQKAVKKSVKKQPKLNENVSDLLPPSKPSSNKKSNTRRNRKTKAAEKHRSLLNIKVIQKATDLFPMSKPYYNQNGNPPSSKKVEQQTVEEQNVTSKITALPIPLTSPLSIPLCNRDNHNEKSVEEQAVFHVEVMPETSTLFPLPVSPSNQNSDPLPNKKLEQKIAEEKPKFSVKECPGCGKIFKFWGLMQRHYKSCSENMIKCKYCHYKAKDNTLLEMHVFNTHPNISSEEALIQIVSAKTKSEE